MECQSYGVSVVVCSKPGMKTVFVVLFSKDGVPELRGTDGDILEAWGGGGACKPRPDRLLAEPRLVLLDSRCTFFLVFLKSVASCPMFKVASK